MNPPTPAKPPTPPTQTPAAKPEERLPKDKGFDASHGYGPAHGGPSGPGDTPAKPNVAAPAPPPKPAADDDDSDDDA
jgi:hypothetical protein